VPEAHLKRDEQLVRPLDILISTANSFELVGKVAQVKQMPVKATLGAFISLIRVPSQLDARYFYYHLSSAETQQRIRNLASTTTNISNVSTKKLKTLTLTVPPLNEQRRIVEKIEELFVKLDAGIQSLKQTQALLESYRRAVLKAAVEGELSREWREAHSGELEPASELLERIVQERREKFAGKKYKDPASPDTSGLPKLPEGWEWVTVDQVSKEVRYGSSSKTNEDSTGIPVLRMGNIQNGQLVADALKYLPTEHEEFPELLLEPGDLLFNRTNSYELVGKTGVYRGTLEPCSFASYLIRVRFLSGVHSQFVASFINSAYGREWISSVVSQQVGQANVNGTKLKALSVPLPPQAEQHFIVDEVERRLSVVDKLETTVEANLKQADSLRQSILKRAFSGKLVPQDLDDEPASMLLERIRAERQAAKPKARKGRKSNARPTKSNHAEQRGLF